MPEDCIAQMFVNRNIILLQHYSNIILQTIRIEIQNYLDTHETKQIEKLEYELAQNLPDGHF